MANAIEDAEEHVEHAGGDAKGVLTKRVGPLPVWGWAAALAGAAALAYMFSKAAGYSAATTTSTNPVTTGIAGIGSSGGGAGSGGGGTSPAPLPASPNDPTAPVGVTTLPGPGIPLPSWPTTPVPVIPTYTPPTASVRNLPPSSVAANGGASSPNGGPTAGAQTSQAQYLTNDAGQSTGALPGLQASGNAPDVYWDGANLVYTGP